MLKAVFYRVVATLVGAAIAFYIGFVASEAAFEYWYVPSAVKESPHDGQIGLSVFVGSAYCACACAIIVLASARSGRQEQLGAQEFHAIALRKKPADLKTFRLQIV